MEKTRLRLNICGVEIIVSGDTDRQAAEKIADTVRTRMQRILSTAYAATTDKAAVITAMNLCEELESQAEELEAAKTRVAELEKALEEARAAEPVKVPVQAVPTGPKQAMRNPLRPDFGDQTGLVSFFAIEDTE